MECPRTPQTSFNVKPNHVHKPGEGGSLSCGINGITVKRQFKKHKGPFTI